MLHYLNQDHSICHLRCNHHLHAYHGTFCKIQAAVVLFATDLADHNSVDQVEAAFTCFKVDVGPLLLAVQKKLHPSESHVLFKSWWVRLQLTYCETCCCTGCGGSNGGCRCTGYIVFSRGLQNFVQSAFFLALRQREREIVRLAQKQLEQEKESRRVERAEARQQARRKAREEWKVWETQRLTINAAWESAIAQEEQIWNKLSYRGEFEEFEEVDYARSYTLKCQQAVERFEEDLNSCYRNLRKQRWMTV
jgi:predicted nucleic acid-binding protein